MDTPDLPGDRRAGNNGLIVVGTLAVAVGVLSLVDRWTDRDVPMMHSWWPFLLMAMGAARLASPKLTRDGRPRSSRSGVWLILVGLWGAISESQVFGFTYGTSWPLLVIAAGVMVIWRAVDPSPSCREQRP